MEGAPGGHGSPAPGHPSARLRPEEPQQEYKRESFDLFTQMLETLKRDVVSILSRVQVQERDVGDGRAAAPAG